MPKSKKSIYPFSLVNYWSPKIDWIKESLPTRNFNTSNIRDEYYWIGNWDFYHIQQKIYTYQSQIFNTLNRTLTLIEKTFNINHYTEEERSEIDLKITCKDFDEHLLANTLQSTNHVVTFIADILPDIRTNKEWSASCKLRSLLSYNLGQTKDTMMCHNLNIYLRKKIYIEEMLKLLKTKTPYQHFFRTSSIIVEENNESSKEKRLNIIDKVFENKHNQMITVRILNISDFFHDLLSGILHQKIPNHILPNSRKEIISRNYYAYNVLLSIVCMEWILLICHNIEKSLHFKQREDKYYFGEVLQNLLDGKSLDYSTHTSNIMILNSYLNDFFQYRDKINVAYTQTVDEYIKLLSEIKNYSPSIHQKFG